MSLSSLVVGQEFIKVGEDGFHVKGLTLEALIGLLPIYSKELVALFNKNDVSKVIKSAPNFVGDLIACAAGEPDQANIVKNLPAGVQLIAATKIIDLTMLDWDAAGNAVGDLWAKIEGLLDQVEGLEIPSMKHSKNG